MTTIVIPDWLVYVFAAYVVLDCISIAQRIVIAYYKRKLDKK